MGANWWYYNSPNGWPYTNFHELNLDWILEKLKEQETDTTTIQQSIDATNVRIDQTNKNVSNLSTQNLATLKVAEHGRAVYNHFDNSYFIDPINQRGATTYNSPGYCIDRWILSSGSVSIGTSGITITGATFGQRVALKAGIYTFEFHLSTGTTLFINIHYDGSSSVTQIGGEANITGAYITAANYSPGIVMFQFVQSENVVHTATWAALYEGSYTASDGPDYVPKGYAAEMAECQRYYRELYRVFGKDIGNVTREAVIINPPMRTNPTSTVKELWKGTTETSVTISQATPVYVDVMYTGYGNVILSESADL